MKRILFAAMLVALALLATAPAALAANGLPDEIVVGEDYTLAAGETLNGNLIVYGGDAVLEEGSRVTGDVVIVGGSLDASGEIGGDAVVTGGSGTLHETAIVHGDLVAIGGNVNREPGAQVQGQDINTVGPRWTPDFSISGVPFWRWLQWNDLGFGNALRAFGWAVTMGVVALLVLVFWPEQTARVQQVIRSAPVAAGGMGLLTAIAGAAVFSVLILALCLGLLGWVGLIAAALFGWVALGSIVGLRVAPVLKLNDLHLAASGALGTFGLTLVVELLRAVPCIGPVVALLLASLGLGAVVLTRFGTRPYFPTPPAAPPNPMPPPEPVESA